MSAALDVCVLFEDADIVVVVKPPGVPSQADKTGDADMTVLLKNRAEAVGLSAVNGAADYFVVHRLDRTVGGVMVYAKTEKAAAVLSAGLARQAGEDGKGGAVKEYLAVAVGELPERGVLTDWLLKNERLNVSKVVPKNTPRAKEAVLSFERLAQTETDDGVLSLARIALETGRHHQIRVQMANAGAPLWGDTKYNPVFARRRGGFPALWAERLTFTHPQTGEAMVFHCSPSREPFRLFRK